MLKLLVKSVRIVISSTIRFAFKPLCVRHRWQLPPHRQQTFHPTSAANLQQYSYVGQNCVTKEEGPSQHLVMIMVMMTMMTVMTMMLVIMVKTLGQGGFCDANVTGWDKERVPIFPGAGRQSIALPSDSQATGAK